MNIIQELIDLLIVYCSREGRSRRVIAPLVLDLQTLVDLINKRTDWNYVVPNYDALRCHPWKHDLLLVDPIKPF